MRPAIAAVTLAAALLVAAFAGPAQARRTYCAKSGDYCLGMFERGNRVYLGLDSFAFRGTARLCVQSPDGKRRCKVFKLRRDRSTKGLYRAHVKWSDHFPHGQKGLYRAVWHYGGTRLPLIHFTIR